jgi:hypothetical protein
MDTAADWPAVDGWWESSHANTIALSVPEWQRVDHGLAASDWSTLDSWWESRPENAFMLSVPERQRLNRPTGQEWPEVGAWWEAAHEADPAPWVDAASSAVSETRDSGLWTGIDDWWRIYARTQHDRHVKLVDAIAASNETWANSPSRFNRDPLATDWAPSEQSWRPLGVSREERWSDWVAHLIQLSTGAFVERLLRDHLEGTLGHVDRETRVTDTNAGYRQVDVLIVDDSGGVSIEIKLNDTNYEKTLDAARLVEQNYGGDWTHLLLVPRNKVGSLEASFVDAVTDDEEWRHRIDPTESEALAESPGVSVLYWEDVASALRGTLLAAAEPDPQWAASAYLFVTLIEQRLRNFDSVRPEEIADSVTESVSTGLTTGGLLQRADIDAQRSYLDRVQDTQEE